MILVITIFVLDSVSFADITRISEDVKEPYNKDFNLDGKYVVTIDAGHGGSSVGISRSKYFYSNDKKDIVSEKDLSLLLSKKIKEYLDIDGRITTNLTRDTDVDVSLADRGEIAKNNNSDVMISIHFNAAPTYGQSARSMGMEIWQSVIDMYKPKGLASCIFKELNKNHFLQIIRGARERASTDSYWNYDINDAQSENNGNAADYYGVIKAGARNRVPTIIVEHLFFTNDNDFSILLDEKNIDEMAKRESKAILNWFFT